MNKTTSESVEENLNSFSNTFIYAGEKVNLKTKFSLIRLSTGLLLALALPHYVSRVSKSDWSFVVNSRPDSLIWDIWLLETPFHISWLLTLLVNHDTQVTNHISLNVSGFAFFWWILSTNCVSKHTVLKILFHNKFAT